tara:strand:- start:2291 stop:2587 length:297 start_codon:yes stop_codon:yes gene_type:complete
MSNLSNKLIGLAKKYNFEPITTGGNIELLDYWQHPTHHFVLGSAKEFSFDLVKLNEPVVVRRYAKSDEDWINAPDCYEYENAEAAMKHIYETKGNLEK